MAPTSMRNLGFFLIVFLNIITYSIAEFDFFSGFDHLDVKPVLSNSSTKTMNKTYGANHGKIAIKRSKKILPLPYTTSKPTTVSMPTTSEDLLQYTNIPYKPFVCPENEEPLNIGPYEVPTQKDLVVHMKKTLLKLFKRYHKKALFFLKDISEATRATSVIEKKCPIRSKPTYKLCVRYVSNQCQLITKSLVTSLERQRHDVSAFTETTICNMSSMKADPVQLIKTIAMEDAALEFALPGFLRLLGACSVYCHRTQITAHWKKPKRHMTDQDLVIKHFLTKKNYAQLIKGTL